MREPTFIRKPNYRDYKIPVKELVTNFFALLLVQNYETDNSNAAKLLHGKILNQEIRSSNFAILSQENRKLISKTSGIELEDTSELLEFLQELEKRLE